MTQRLPGPRNDSGNETVASERAQAALKLDPLNSTAHYVLGAIAVRRGGVDTARRSFELALESIGQMAGQRATFALPYIDQDRIAQALAKAQPR
jgi:Flp pilus assembly protein TadD